MGTEVVAQNARCVGLGRVICRFKLQASRVNLETVVESCTTGYSMDHYKI